MPSNRKCTSGSLPASSRWRSRSKAPQQEPAGGDHERRQREPERFDGRVARLQPPQLLACSTPKTIRLSPSADSTEPTQSSAGRSPSRAGSRNSRANRRIAITRTTSPANTSRHVRFVVSQPPRIGPTAIPAPRPRRGLRRPSPGRVRCRCPRPRRRAPATPSRHRSPRHRPAERQRGDAPGSCGQGRADAVDHQSDDEHPPPPEQVPELAAGEHQRRHDQRIERDHGLDRGDGGVEVGDQLGDRDVHHRLVQDHQELGRGETIRAPHLPPMLTPPTAGLMGRAANTESMEDPLRHSAAGRVIERRVDRKGLRPRVAAG